MTYQNTQCVIFFKRRFGYDHRAGMHLKSDGRVTGSGALDVSTRTVKAVALLPVAFCNGHQSVVSHFNKNEVHILRHGDELRIGGEEELCIFECLLEENLGDEVDSLSVILTSDREGVDRSRVERILDKTNLAFRKKDVSCTDALTRPAIDDQNAEVFQRLLSGCYRNYYGFSRHRLSLLPVAILNGQDLLVKLSIHHGADLNDAVYVQNGVTPLHFTAAKENKIAIVELLLERGAHVNARDFQQKTPLHLAAEQNLLNNAKLLLQHGAGVEARCAYGRTPLHFAALHSDDSSKLVQLLIDEGASVNVTDNFGRTPLHQVENPEAAKALLENGADLNCEDNENRTPLLSEIFGLAPQDVMKILLDYGAHITCTLDNNLGLCINGRSLSHKDMLHDDFEYLLNRCFVRVDFEYSNERRKLFPRPNLESIFARHLVRIVSLKLRNRYGFDVAYFWNEHYEKKPLSVFKEQCEMEVSRMKSQLIAGTDLSVYELLAKDEQQVARLLRNQSITLDTDELKTMFPEYGLMLTCSVKNGRNRLAWHEQGIVSCNLLSANFKRMPDEIKENIVSRLSIADIRSAKKACAFLS